MYHKEIKTKSDAIDYLRKGDIKNILDRLDNLPEMIIREETEEEVPVEA